MKFTILVHFCEELCDEVMLLPRKVKSTFIKCLDPIPANHRSFVNDCCKHQLLPLVKANTMYRKNS